MKEWEDRIRKKNEEADRNSQLASERYTEELHAECAELYPYLEGLQVRELLEGMNRVFWLDTGSIDLVEGRAWDDNANIVYVGYRLQNVKIDERTRLDTFGLPYRSPTLYTQTEVDRPNLIVATAEQSVTEYTPRKRFLFIRHVSRTLELPRNFQYDDHITHRIPITIWEFGKQRTSSDDEISRKLQEGLLEQRYFMEHSTPLSKKPR